MSSELAPTSSETKISKPNSKRKAKGKENATKLVKTAPSSSKGAPPAPVDLPSVDEGAAEEETDWPWTTLADSSVGSRPVVFTADGKYVAKLSTRLSPTYSPLATFSQLSGLQSGSTLSHQEGLYQPCLHPHQGAQYLASRPEKDTQILSLLLS